MKTTTYKIGNANIEFSAPSIKRDFWFAEDTRTLEEWHEVQEHVRSCENENYFISENLKDTNAYRYLFHMSDKRFRLWLCESTWNGVKHEWIASGHYNDMDGDRYFVHELNETEREQLRKACNAEQEKFTKRLRTYLKRYGLSKCRFETFWAMR